MELENSLPASDDAALSQTEAVSDDSANTHEGALPDVYELEKLPKFKFQGQELTAQELEKLVLFQKDYTKKSQTLAQQQAQIKAEKEAIAEDRKFSDNLRADLDHVRNNPRLAANFLDMYPAKYHQYLQQVLSELNPQANPQQSPQNQTPSYELLALQKEVRELRSTAHSGKIAEETARLNSNIERLQKEYPDAIAELAIGRVYTAWHEMQAKDPNAKVPDQMWEDTFRAVNDEMKARHKTKYSANVKQQLDANSKGRGVPPGGATPGRPAQKFKSLNEVTKQALARLKSNGI